MDKVIKRFDKVMMCSLLVSLLDVILGVVFVQFTSLSTKVNLVLLGALVIIHGIFYVIRYLYDGLGRKFFAVDIIAGVVSIILGVFMIVCPFSALNSIGILFCIWLCINAAEVLYYTYNFFKAQESMSPLLGFMGLLLIIMGLLCAFNPFEVFMLITRLVGIFLVCSGLINAMISRLFKKRAKFILDLFE